MQQSSLWAITEKKFIFYNGPTQQCQSLSQLPLGEMRGVHPGHFASLWKHAGSGGKKKDILYREVSGLTKM